MFIDPLTGIEFMTWNIILDGFFHDAQVGGPDRVIQLPNNTALSLSLRKQFNVLPSRRSHIVGSDVRVPRRNCSQKP
jgi:hypothetical protein